MKIFQSIINNDFSDYLKNEQENFNKGTINKNSTSENRTSLHKAGFSSLEIKECIYGDNLKNNRILWTV